MHPHSYVARAGQSLLFQEKVQRLLNDVGSNGKDAFVALRCS